ncbi:MAG: APC family permease [Thiotrichales bacterium]
MRHETKAKLQRRVGFWLLTFYGLGNILGAGIYVLIGKVAGEAGFLAPISFLLAAGVAAFTALTYSELSARFPVAAGEAVYLDEAFSLPALSFITGLLITFAGLFSAATIALGFAGYAQVYASLSTPALVILLMLGLGGLAIWGISQSVIAASLLTLVETVGLLAVLFLLPGHQPEMLAALEALQSSDWTMGGLVAGAFLAFYAYVGFEDMVNIAEEVRDPEKNMPRAIIAALVISTLLYAAVVFAAVSLVAPGQLAASGAPLAEVFRQAGISPAFITLVGMFAVINGALIQIIMASRILYGMSSRGWLPVFFGQVNPRTHTPVNATVIVVLIIVVLALLFPLQRLAEFTSYLVLVVFTMINLALIRLRKKQAPGAAVYINPSWVPWFGAATSLALLVAQLLVG